MCNVSFGGKQQEIKGISIVIASIESDATTDIQQIISGNA